MPRSNAIARPPWRNRQDHFSPLKLAVLLALCLPALLLALWAARGELGSRPVTEAIHMTGLWAIRILLISLLVTPLRQMLRWPRALLVRRMLGLGALSYALIHLLLFAVDLKWDLAKVISEIALRIYLTIGFAALLGLVVLGVTSTDGWVRRLGGRRWQALHRVAYAIAVLALVHFTLQTKLDVTEAMLTAGLFLWLMGYRLLAPKGGAPAPIRLVALAFLAAAGTALLEAGWYGVATGIPFWPVLQANLDVTFGLRPALWVGLAGFGMAALGLAGRWGGAPRPLLRRQPG
ncbi:protein-methionine-sulfoxide reductase heme-binding subunit MsrQ [Teichococcus vastitatis]|uniref:Protein-methionine-sulfoxide reductase heme-binding subunit MsrQ n=1 Tax=Teichococcus vastitatis TaxID=2307076 RepID=A0ABS9W0X9_9PROT|nr:protein-methionine-sulfoxide reductase heme-binding subunit MsrQ [Pseudoroseomonas vastitatis]MCI0752952.1 sulfoxide reductase heme-binding subunit YedZ [Pseudoroseomonas vastitatis]